MLRRTSVGVALTVALLVLTGCFENMPITPIPDVIKKPADFENREIRVEGVVGKTVTDAGTGGSTRYYQLETRIATGDPDNPYFILKVLSPADSIPKEGRALWVKGFVKRNPGQDPVLHETDREIDWEKVIWILAFCAVGVVLIVLVVVLVKVLRGGGDSEEEADPALATNPAVAPETQMATGEPRLAPAPRRKKKKPAPKVTKIVTDGYLMVERGRCVPKDGQNPPRLPIYQNDAREGLVLGRDPARSGLTFEGSSVSGAHARLYWDQDGFSIQNVCSVDKTWTAVNGAKLRPHETVELKQDDVIELGQEVELTFHRVQHGE